MKTWFIATTLFLSSTLGSFAVNAQESTEELMTPEQIRAYMSAYDRGFDQEFISMQQLVEEGLLLGRIRFDQAHYCHEFSNHKEAALLKIDKSMPDYHQRLGLIDGEFDAKKEGCQRGYAAMEQRLEHYAKEIKPRWREGVDLGHKVAVIKLELFGNDLESLARSCLHGPKVEGIVNTFLKEELKQEDRLAAIQADCQGQAREMVAIMRDMLDREQQNQRILAEDESTPRTRVFAPARVERVPAAGASR
jgi:hypothetical protein